ncbi:uncharacterized protein LOC124374730, partial [Homalodisca vitripennis]|uniref:uncharacterized protein LOC124374730 n=1 Tax=Homalodisca vitripennis TaxID=197043 RepID=UPI001EEA2FAD
MSELSKELKRVLAENTQLKKENQELRGDISGLHVRVRNLEQYSRRQNVEIDGIPETQGENVLRVLESVAEAVGVELKKENIVAAHRIPSFNKKRTPPIIVRFSTYEERDTWIREYKSMRPLMLNMINPGFKSSAKVFVNEHISPENKLLLAKTKEAARNKGFKYVWSRDGKIFVRKEDGEKCKKIDSAADLETLQKDRVQITKIRLEDGRIEQNPQAIANLFNDYFVSVAQQLITSPPGPRPDTL